MSLLKFTTGNYESSQVHRTCINIKHGSQPDEVWSEAWGLGGKTADKGGMAKVRGNQETYQGKRGENSQCLSREIRGSHIRQACGGAGAGVPEINSDLECGRHVKGDRDLLTLERHP